MTDYAAVPVQPIVQGLITLVNPDVPDDGIDFFGIGIVQNGPFAPVRNGAGSYTLTRDPGLPGDVAINPLFGRFMMTVCGPNGIAAGAPTAIESKSLTYLTSPLLNANLVGANQIEIFLAAGGAGTDFETGLEIILWRADAGVELTNLNIIGPLFAPQGSAVP